MKSLLLTAVATLGLTAATMAQNVPSYVPANGLVGWWPFNGNANDESGNGNNGTVNGATLTADRFGNVNQAYGFDGVNDYINGFINNSNLSDLTFSVWVNTVNSSGGTFVHLGSDNGSPLCNGVGLGNFNAPNNNLVGHYSCIGFFNSSSNFIANQWSHCTMVKLNNVLYFYVNGIQMSQVSTSGFINPDNNFWFGSTYSNYIAWFLGKLDDIGIWNRALTQQEITDLFNAVNCSNNTAITPQTNSLSIGSTATFTATTSDPNPTYDWQSDFGQGFQTLNNFGNYSGVISSTLNIANIQLANHNQPIRVISTSGNCIDTSNLAVINILDTCITNVTVYDTLLTTVTDTLIINTQITGINPPNNSNTIKVYPNPANTHITIDYGNFAIMNGYQLKIENSLGQLVFQTNITQQSDYLSLSTWGGNGLYFVHIIDPQGNTIDIRKIVLQ